VSKRMAFFRYFDQIDELSSRNLQITMENTDLCSGGCKTTANTLSACYKLGMVREHCDLDDFFLSSNQSASDKV